MDNQLINKNSIQPGNLDTSVLDNLSPEEKALALSILQEYSKEGKSNKLNDLVYEDYQEIPVDILTFVDDYNYLGNAWHDSEGKSKLYPYWREELLKIFPDNLKTNVNNAIFSGSRGRGKMNPLSTPVLTADGFKPMGSIKIGDKVFGEDGETHKVVGVFPQGKLDVYEVIFSDGTSSKCGLEHLWEVVDHYIMKNHKAQKPERKVVDTKYLLEHSNNSRRFSIPMCQPINFKKQQTLLDPYILGCLLGDGHLSSKVYVSISTKDEYIINYFKQDAEKRNYHLKVAKNNTDFKLMSDQKLEQISDNYYIKTLTELGLIDKLSEDKFIPENYLFSDVNDRIALLQGLLDTDGEAKKNTRRCDRQIGYSIIFNTISPKLKNDVCTLVESLGGTARWTQRPSKYVNTKGEAIKCKDHFRICIKLPSSITPFRLNRKLDLYNLQAHQEPSRYIKAIRKLEQQEECQCIYIDSPRHLYLVNNFIVTHNTEVATLVAAYLLHRILCLKDPVAHFHLKPTEKIVFAFMNIKLALAEEIGISKFQNTLQSSPWFMSHGYLEGRTKKLWMPQKYNDQIAIDIKIGSQADDLIGLPIYFCLDGKTPILTSEGVFNIEELVDKNIQVPTIDDAGQITLSNVCTVKPTAKSSIEYEIELEDGTIIKCTPSHRFRLIDGSYKEAQELTESDELMTTDPYGYIYKTTNLVNGKIYIGQHKGQHLDETYLGSGYVLQKAIKKYGKNNFKCEILDFCIDKCTLDGREKEYIKQFKTQDSEIDYNIADGGQRENLGEFVNQRISNSLMGVSKSPLHKQHLAEANRGKHLTENQKRKISAGNQGKKVTQETRRKMHDSVKKLDHSDYRTNKGKIAITNGWEVKYIDKNAELPQNYVYSNCKTATPHDMSKYYADANAQKQKSEAHRGAKNSMYGKGYLRRGGLNTNAHTRYFYKNHIFECRKDLLQFLKQHVDANISTNLIRSIERGTYKKRTAIKYCELIGQLTWERK